MPTKLSLAQKALYIVPFKSLNTSKAWKLTSEYVRRASNGVCYTCGGRFPLEKLSAGHFIEKRGNANTYFDLDNLKAQCSWNCNRKAGGRKDVYAKKLIHEYGPNIIDDLFRRAGKARVWTKLDLEKIAEERAALIKQLEQNGYIH